MDALFTWIGAAVAPVCTGLMAVLLYKVQKRSERSERQADKIDQIAKNMNAISELATSVAALTEETTRQGHGLKVLLRSAMHDDHGKLMKQGWASSQQLHDFREAYDIYAQEGGNGVAQRWLDDIMRLPINDDPRPSDLLRVAQTDMEDLL